MLITAALAITLLNAGASPQPPITPAGSMTTQEAKDQLLARLDESAHLAAITRSRRPYVKTSDDLLAVVRKPQSMLNCANYHPHPATLTSDPLQPALPWGTAGSYLSLDANGEPDIRVFLKAFSETEPNRSCAIRPLSCQLSCQMGAFLPMTE